MERRELARTSLSHHSRSVPSGGTRPARRGPRGQTLDTGPDAVDRYTESASDGGGHERSVLSAREPRDQSPSGSFDGR